MKSCLVLIDIQSGFLTPYTNKVIAEIERILCSHKDDFDHIVATRFVNADGGPFVRIMKWNNIMDAESTVVDQYIEGISERVFEKNLYSCFTAEFESFLIENRITKVYFAGIDTDCCVLKSAVDCFEKNLDVEILLNACASTGGKESDIAGEIVLERLIGKDNINKIW